MSYCDQRGFDARFEWGGEGLGVLVNAVDVVVIVDVFSFGTAVDIAVGRGAAIVPYPTRDAAAIAFAETIGAELAVGHRETTADRPYSLSPASLHSIPPSTRLVLPSANGSTLATLAATSGATVLAGCLRNAGAVGRAAGSLGRTVAVIAAGERWKRDRGELRVAFEDLIGAGAVLAALRAASPSPEARAAIAAFVAVADDLPGLLSTCSSGREQTEAGFSGDVDLAADLDASATVPWLSEGAFTAWTGQRRIAGIAP